MQFGGPKMTGYRTYFAAALMARTVDALDA